jgi:uncharacterized protein (DUF433 family)
MDPTLTTHTETVSSLPGLPWRRKHIVSTPGTCVKQPRIRGTRVRVKDVVLWHGRMVMGPEQIVSEWPQLNLGDVYAALASYDDNRARIEEEMRAEQEFADRFEKDASLTLRSATGQDADDPLPSR